MSTKLSVEQATELFKKMEMEVVVVADSEEADKNPDIESMSKAAFSEMEAKVESEKGAEIKDEARREESGKQLGTLRRAIKRHYGVDEKEMDKLTMDEIVKLVKERSTTNKADADNDLMKRYEDLQAEHEKALETQKNEYETKFSQQHEQFVNRDMEERLLSLVTNTPRTGGDALAQTKSVMQALKGTYEMKLNDNKEIEFFDKSNPEKKAFDGKNVITDKYAVEKFLTTLGVKATDTRNIIPADVVAGKQTTVQAGVAKVDHTDPIAFLESAMTGQ